MFTPLLLTRSTGVLSMVMGGGGGGVLTGPPPEIHHQLLGLTDVVVVAPVIQGVLLFSAS